MKRIYTESEFIRFYTWIPLVLLVGGALVFWRQDRNVENAFVGFMICLLVVILLEILLFMLWYPKEHKKKKAIKYGKEYIGKIKSIKGKSKSRYTAYKRNYVYVVNLEVIIDGKSYIVEEGDFSDNPGEYFCSGDNCKVYLYNGELYPDFLYIDEKKNKKEMKVSQNTKQVYLSVPPISYTNEVETKNILVIITAKACKVYDSTHFSLYEKIVEYLGRNEGGEEIIREKIREIVTQAIHEKDPAVEIQEIKIFFK